MRCCQIRAPHGGRLDRRSRPTPNKGFALAWGPRLRHSKTGAQINVNYKGDGEV